MWWKILIAITVILYVISFFTFKYVYHNDKDDKVSPFPSVALLLTLVPILGVIIPMIIFNIFQDEYKDEEITKKRVIKMNNKMFGKPRRLMTQAELREKDINNVIK